MINMASFTAYRASSSRSSSMSEDGSKDLKSSIRESRLIQPEQWDLPEIQQRFDRVKDLLRKKNNIFLFIYFRVISTFLKYIVHLHNLELKFKELK